MIRKLTSLGLLALMLIAVMTQAQEGQVRQSFMIKSKGLAVSNEWFEIPIPEKTYAVDKEGVNFVLPLFGIGDDRNCIAVLWGSKGKGDPRESFFVVAYHLETGIFTLDPEKDKSFFEDFVAARHLFFQLGIGEGISSELTQDPIYDQEARTFSLSVRYGFPDGTAETVKQKIFLLEQGALVLTGLVFGDEPADQVPTDQILANTKVFKANNPMMANEGEEPTSYLSLMSMFDPTPLTGNQGFFRSLWQEFNLLHAILLIVGAALLLLATNLQKKVPKEAAAE